ncbi:MULTISPECIES: heavy metal translocating P-type ATPase [Marivivens]|jgi:Cd2+/Zn2+-exporting ATPase|uniref:heavy metal translocating P-type ATPase n=1 Tax=Marivivens TaxID=1759396 RepID=UPI0007FF7B9A|nr:MULTISPECIES: heavy metal translocating P-type ATPase [Marivivens]MCL7404574.1 cadmium-translocating P-type ATPase [Marivivens geojensis]OBR38063.1 ATPase [Donghicola sp. JL3646]APO88098.1 ATPase [Marivivens sp. JLT3646]MCL7408863.1 cadmium-translocating P-type ATPase [Marivivens donghaensis]MDN3703094.1 heavy metal translocating P-type ATPase [Marivivens donghaensis]
MADGSTELREWRVTGMDCGSCAAKVRGAVERLPGVADVDVALMAERLRLTLDERQTSPESIEKAVRGVGFGIAAKGAQPEKPKGGFVLPDGAFPLAAEAPDPKGEPAEDAAEQPQEAPTPSWYQTAKGQLVIGTGALLAAAWASRFAFPADIAHWAFILATLIGLVPVAQRAFAMARARMPFTIEMLMTIAAGGALVIGEAEEAALVVFLFAVGELLEGVAAGKARDSIRALSKLVPKTAQLEVGGKIREVPAERLQVGQVVQVRPGDRVPCDGEVIDGTSGVDESPVTGESVPSLKEPGAEVFAGSINAEALLRVRVTKAADDNTIARIVRLVEEAESARAPTERFIDRFSRVYMPAVVGAAVLVAVVPPLAFGLAWGDWVYRALALLLIGCPCALVISVPASITSALSTGARNGLLMKGGAVIEAAARTTHVAFDKTGTLTHGKPRVTDITALSGSVDELLSLAAGVESGASHPLGQAICAEAERRGVDAAATTGGHALPGKGAEAAIDGVTVSVGSPRLADERGALTNDLRTCVAALEAGGKTVVIVLRDDVPQGLIALRDEPRADAAVAVAQLRTLGISSVMLTGDNKRTAQAIAEGLGIAHHSELMPEDKVTAIRDLTSDARVMMIGDGINDAPALAAAHVGVAMGSGTDVALETADAAILRNRVTDVASKIRLARATMTNIRQNIAIALGLKAVFLVTTLLGITGLWIAILADTGATVLVTMNALRLLFFRPSVAIDTPQHASHDNGNTRSDRVSATT